MQHFRAAFLVLFGATGGVGGSDRVRFSNLDPRPRQTRTGFAALHSAGKQSATDQNQLRHNFATGSLFSCIGVGRV
jgi:hypothetical protein